MKALKVARAAFAAPLINEDDDHATIVGKLRAAHPSMPLEDIEACARFTVAIVGEEKRARAIIIDDDCDCRWRKRT